MTTLEILPAPDESEVFYVSGEFDMDAEELFNAWMPAMTAGSGRVTLDLSNLTFIDSTGLRCILQLAARREVILRNPQRSVRRIIVIAGLETIPEMHIEE